MKQINFLFILAFSILCSCGGPKTKHIITETGQVTLAGEEFRTYSVDNEYSINIPLFLKKRPNDPDRFSLECNYSDIEDLGCNLTSEDLKNVGLWMVLVENDTRETFEARRNKQGNLDKYPFTLEGFLNVAVKDGDKSTIKFIGKSQEITINNMPALLQTYESIIDVNIAKAYCYGCMIHVQADKDKIYRLDFRYPQDEGDEEYIPEWVTEVYNSFQLL